MGCGLSTSKVAAEPTLKQPNESTHARVQPPEASYTAPETAPVPPSKAPSEKISSSSNPPAKEPDPRPQLPPVVPSPSSGRLSRPSEIDGAVKHEPAKLPEIGLSKPATPKVLPKLDDAARSAGSSPIPGRAFSGGGKSNQRVGQLSTSKISDREFGVGGGASSSAKGGTATPPRRSLDEMDLPDPTAMQRDAQRTGDKKRSHSIGSEYGSIRFTEQGRIAVSSESELELRTKLSQLPTTNSISKKEAEFVLNVIRTHFLFAKMSTEQLLRTVQYMERLTLMRGDPLVKQGEANARHFYIIYTGGMDVTVQKEGEKQPIVVAHLGASACRMPSCGSNPQQQVGEMALLYNSQRTATVTATAESHVFCLSRAAYQLTLIEDGGSGGTDSQASGGKDGRSSRLDALRRATWLYDAVPENHKADVSKALQEVRVPGGESMLKSSQVGGVLLLLLEGELQFTGDPHKIHRDAGAWRSAAFGELCTDAILSSGDVVAIGRPGDEGLLAVLYNAGENNQGKLKLLGGSNHRCSVRSLTEVRFLAIAMQELLHYIGPAPAILSSHDGIRAMMLNIPWCRDITRKELDALAFAFKPQMFTQGDSLISQGALTPALNLIVSGSVRVFKNVGEGDKRREALICHAEPGDVLGERSLVAGSPAMATCTASIDSVALLLSREEFASMLPQRMQPRLERRRYASQIGQGGMELTELAMCAVIGVGAFARVALVRHRPSGEVFALKKMDRQHLVVENMQKQIMNERFVLGDFDHPCIAKLIATFKSKHSLYMLLEPCLGGELYSHMRKVRRLDEPAARFYAACVVSAFEYMHSRNVLYRDLKPENVVIASNGYIKVVDFGFAKRVFTRTYTVCGTPEYLAPELIMMKGHGKGVDWWALGVLLYEVVVGAVPFTFVDNRPQYGLPPTELYKNILNPRYRLYLPSRLSSPLCDIIKRLLAWDPLTRIGCLTDGAADVKGHPFFADMDWEKLLDMELPPPHVPELRSGTDMSHFDDPTVEPGFLNEPEYDYAVPTQWDIDF